MNPRVRKSIACLHIGESPLQMFILRILHSIFRRIQDTTRRNVYSFTNYSSEANGCIVSVCNFALPNKVRRMHSSSGRNRTAENSSVKYQEKPSNLSIIIINNYFHLLTKNKKIVRFRVWFIIGHRTFYVFIILSVMPHLINLLVLSLCHCHRKQNRTRRISSSRRKQAWN